MTTIIYLNEHEVKKIYHAAKLNIDRESVYNDNVHPQNYRLEEERIIDCIAVKHNADFIQLPSIKRWWE